MTSSVDQWVSRALYDLETARAMVHAGRYLYVFFCCQQAIEKMLKAVIARRTGKAPPRLHKLVNLAGVAELQVSKETIELMDHLTFYYIESRYPGGFNEEDEEAEAVLVERAIDLLERTEGLVKWLQSIL